MSIETSELFHCISSDTLISQGDIIKNFPLILPNITAVRSLRNFDEAEIAEQIKVDLFYTDLIVMSQACDLVSEPDRGRTPLDFVVCAQVATIDNFSKRLVLEANSNKLPNYFLLHKDDTLLDKSLIVDFNSIHSIRYEILDEFRKKSGDRIRPVSPILEKLSHHFGNFFSRIGTEFERDKNDLKTEYDHLESLKQQIKSSAS